MDTTSSGISGMSAKDICGPTPLIEIQNELPARLIVDPPLPEQLAEGRSTSNTGRKTCASRLSSAKARSRCRHASVTSTLR